MLYRIAYGENFNFVFHTDNRGIINKIKTPSNSIIKPVSDRTKNNVACYIGQYIDKVLLEFVDRHGCPITIERITNLKQSEE